MALHLEIVTPEKKIFSDTVGNVYLPGADGELGILDGHAALVTALRPGELRYEKNGQTVFMAIGTGFAEVTEHRVNVLTDLAAEAEQIDETKVEEAMRRAEQHAQDHEGLCRVAVRRCKHRDRSHVDQ